MTITARRETERRRAAPYRVYGFAGWHEGRVAIRDAVVGALCLGRDHVLHPELLGSDISVPECSANATATAKIARPDVGDPIRLEEVDVVDVRRAHAGHEQERSCEEYAH